MRESVLLFLVLSACTEAPQRLSLERAAGYAPAYPTHWGGYAPAYPAYRINVDHSVEVR
jgi:hypothetical protein